METKSLWLKKDILMKDKNKIPNNIQGINSKNGNIFIGPNGLVAPLLDCLLVKIIKCQCFFIFMSHKNNH